MKHSVLITGKPGVGKSTVVKQLLSSADSNATTGILSGEIRKHGKRQGFTIQAVGQAPGILASPDLQGEPRFGTMLPDGKRRLGLSLVHLDENVCPTIHAALPHVRLVVIDEIGPMQAESRVFRELVEHIIASPIQLVASIGMQAHPWLDKVRHDERFELLELTPRNRDLMADLLCTYIS